MYDSVYPTRTARFGVALVPDGTLKLRNSEYAADFRCASLEHSAHVRLQAGKCEAAIWWLLLSMRICKDLPRFSNCSRYKLVIIAAGRPLC